MSDVGPEPPPPPPPPDLAPPPGYAAYAPNLSASMPLRRVGGLRTGIVVLLAVFSVGALIQLAGIAKVVDSARDFLAGNLSEDDFRNDLGVYSLSGLVTSAAQIALAVLSIVWLYRIVRNHQDIGRRVTWTPGWAVGGWFLPPVIYIIPTLVLRETWKAADPEVAPGDDRWKSGSDNPLLWVWFVVYVVGSVIVQAVSFRVQFRTFGGDMDEVADTFKDARAVLVAQAIVGVLGAVAWALVVRAWTARHIRLTGEAAGR